MMLHGSCCCGSVAFELTTMPTMMATCHCSRCRKLGMSTFVFVDRAAFKLAGGADDIAVYEPEPPHIYRRSFCRRCGSSLGEMDGDGQTFPLPANLFDDPLELTVRFHEFVDDKPAWSLIGDNATQFARHPERP